MKKFAVAILLIFVCCIFFACENMPNGLTSELSAHLISETEITTDEPPQSEVIPATDEGSKDATDTSDSHETINGDTDLETDTDVENGATNEHASDEENTGDTNGPAEDAPTTNEPIPDTPVPDEPSEETGHEPSADTPPSEDTEHSEEPMHVHTFSAVWSFDREKHWHDATCGHDVTADVAAHLWDDGTVTTTATESKEGVMTYTCTVCRYTETAPIERLPHVHTYGDWTTENAPTCTEKGTEVCRCCACGDKKSRTIPAKGHTEAADPAVSPTCTETGLTAGSHCSVCETVLIRQTVVPAKGHAYGDYVRTKAPNCTDAGEETRTCSACGHVDARALSALGHDYRDTVTPPTCTEGGYTTHFCKRCSHTYTDENVPAKGHSPAVDPALLPTCTETGLTEGSHCSTCGVTLSARETVAAKGHSYGDYRTTAAASCTQVGEEMRTCTACGTEDTRTIPALGHAYGTVVTPPTCTTAGYTTHTCSRCGDNYTDDPTAALGHDLTEHPAKAPTCTSIGWAAYVTCSRCEMTTFETIPMTAHDYGEDGLCAVCGGEAPPTDGLRFTAAGDGTYRVSGYDGEATSVYVPRRYNGGAVTAVDAAAFAGCTSLESLTLPFVGGSADAETADTTTLFGYIFGTAEQTGCTATRQYYSSTGSAVYYIPNSLRTVRVTGGKVLYGTFYGCSDLESITLGSGVTALGKCAFWGCSSLEALTLPFVGDRADVGPMDTYQYPLGYFFGTLSYEDAAYVTQYYYAESPFAPVQASYYLPSSLRIITVSGGKVLYGAFSGCTMTFSVILGESVTSIENAAFSAATGLTEVTIPRSVTYIGNDVFAGCTALTTLRYQGTRAEWADVTKAADWAHNAPAFSVVCTDDEA